MSNANPEISWSVFLLEIAVIITDTHMHIYTNTQVRKCYYNSLQLVLTVLVSRSATSLLNVHTTPWFFLMELQICLNEASL